MPGPLPYADDVRVCLQITGTARGNGRELALQFHRLGARIACVDKDAAGNEETVAQIRTEGGVAAAFRANITDRRQVAEMHEAVRREMGPVDVLVNNAGVIENTLFADPDADDAVKETVDTNLLGQIWVSAPTRDVRICDPVIPGRIFDPLRPFSTVKMLKFGFLKTRTVFRSLCGETPCFPSLKKKK